MNDVESGASTSARIAAVNLPPPIALPREDRVMTQDTDRKKVTDDIAALVVERFNKIHGTSHGADLAKPFSDYSEAQEISTDSLRRHLTNLTSWKLVDPESWSAAKPWLTTPKKGQPKLLKALLAIVREADKVAERKK